MKRLAPVLLKVYKAILIQEKHKILGTYLKWLRYYLDFFEKYRFPSSFLVKLKEKGQGCEKRKQAGVAVGL